MKSSSEQDRAAPTIFVCSGPNAYDVAVATELSAFFQAYRTPTQAIVVTRRVGGVFRDDPIGDVEPDAESLQRVDEAQFLVLVCSLDTPASRRVAVIVERFLVHHDIARVLPLLVNGDPFGAFPKVYLEGATRRLRHGDQDRTVIDYLSAALASGSSRARRRSLQIEALRLLAPVLGTTFDALYERELHRRRKHNTVVALVVTASVLALGIVMIRISATEGWRAEERANHWTDGGAGLVLGSDTTKVTMREGAGGELLLQGIRDGSMSSWSPSTGSRLWRTPFRVVDFWTNGRYNLAAQTDGVTLVAVEHSGGGTLPTPFKLTAPMRSFSAHWVGGGDVLFIQPVLSSRRVLLWSLKTQTDLATLDDIAAPLTDRDRAVNLGPAPEDWFWSNATLTTDLKRMVAPCLRGGRITTCLWNIPGGQVMKELAIDATAAFVGYAIDEKRGLIVTSERGQHNATSALWQLATGRLIASRRFRAGEDLIARVWPTLSKDGTLLVFRQGQFSAILPVSAIGERESKFAIALIASSLGPGSAVDTEAALWQVSPQDAAFGHVGQTASSVLHGMDTSSVDWFIVQSALNRLVTVTPSAIEVWNVSRGERVAAPIPVQRFPIVRVSLDGQTLTIHDNDSRFLVIDLATGLEIFRLPYIAGIDVFTFYERDARRLDVYADSGSVTRYTWRRSNNLSKLWRNAALR